MIKISHVGVWVSDQDEALKFYTETLGFEVRTDASMDNGFRWLTVGPKDQPDLEMILAVPGPPMLDEESAAHMKAMLGKGVLSGGVLRTDDIWATYKDLSAKGVQFLQEPAERPYGIEAIFRDNSGNWFSLGQSA
jgi:catechol 2,3-dioxygenase-like lactoylglutathione lyase family enzyme